eukprot:TRINITY_DN2527_c0_g2_i1.p1 TRINITY_DN2527_c0_g2~~TRINITY_DN2527_c0_g2_i1.p1  ORF type:complete len:205 (-),score=44.59 TRINITY_DN2527_c0_g2_i1:683-1297(-)
MSDSLIAFVGEDYVLIAADSSQSRSIVLQKPDEDKIFPVENNKLLAASGPAGDKSQFCSYIEKNINLYTLRTGVSLTTHAAANYIRGEMAEALRRDPYQVNMLFGGVDSDGPALYFIDYLAAMNKMDFSCAGYAGYFILSLLDKHYKRGLSLEDGMKLMQMCIREMQTRLVLNQNNWIIKVVDKKGHRVLHAPDTAVINKHLDG